jgi:hypothetical protein
MRLRIVVLAGVALASVWIGGSAVASVKPNAATMTTVVSGLDNPRDLAFVGGKLYVAEAGHGGSACFTMPGQGKTCVGFTSAITRVNVAGKSANRVVTGLFSIAGADGSAATGVDGISSRGSQIYGIETGASLSVPPGVVPPGVEAKGKAQIGRLIVANAGGSWKASANVGDRDYIWSGHHKRFVPGQFPDANPYGVVATSSSVLVVDAGSNTLDRVTSAGRVHVLRFIPNPPSSDSVPTCVDKGPGGAIFIGELTGGGNAPGASVVWRYVPATNSLTKWATGLTTVTGCGFGHDGKFYATEFSSLGLDNAAPGTGRVVRVPAHSKKPVTVIGGLSFPGGFAGAADGSLYVSNWSIAPAHGAPGAPTGSVVRITPG